MSKMHCRTAIGLGTDFYHESDQMRAADHVWGTEYCYYSDSHRSYIHLVRVSTSEDSGTFYTINQALDTKHAWWIYSKLSDLTRDERLDLLLVKQDRGCAVRYRGHEVLVNAPERGETGWFTKALEWVFESYRTHVLGGRQVVQNVRDFDRDLASAGVEERNLWGP